jgi:hypothetical protein
MKNQDQMHYDELDLRVIENSGRLDANESVFFARQLEYIKGKTYDILYPEMHAMRLFPISTEAGAGAKTITYHQYDSVGMAKIIANYAQDLPSANVTGKEFTSNIRGVGVSYQYDVQEVRYAQFAGVPLETRKAAAARRAHDEKINQLAWYGDADHGVPGFFTNANIPGYTIPADGTGSSKLFSAKIGTPDLIIRDVNGIINSVRIQSKGVHVANELWLPIAQFALLESTPRSSTSDTTIMEFLRRVNPGVTFKAILELDNALSSNTLDTMVAIDNSAENLTLELPMPLMQHSPQQEGLAFKVPMESRVGGIIIYRPLAMSMADSV